MQLLKKTIFNLFIQTQKTPNPDFLKFLPTGKVVMGSQQTIDMNSIEQASLISPLARKFFRIKGVTQVFYGKNYISISKQQEYNWTQLKPLIFQLMQNHFESDQPLIVDKTKIDDRGINQNDSQTVKLIKQILSSRVRPTVQDDGGDVKYVDFDIETGVLKLKMLGSCSGCPSSTATLKNGILKLMKYYVGQIKDVIAVNLKQQKGNEKKQQKKQGHQTKANIQ